MTLLPQVGPERATRIASGRRPGDQSGILVGHDRTTPRSSRPRRCPRGSTRPDLRIVDVRWVLGTPGAGRAALRRRAHPGRDLPRPRHGPRRARAARAAIPCPTRRDFRRAARGRRDRDADDGRRLRRRSAARSPPGCGGCSTTSATSASRCSTAASPAWLAAGYPGHAPTEPEPRPRGHLELRDAWTQRHRSRRRRRRARLDRPARCPRRAALPRRGRADRPRSPATSRPPATRRPAATSARTARLLDRPPSPRGSTTSAPTARDVPVVTSCGSGVTACLTSLAMRVAGLPTRSSTRAPTRTGPSAGLPSRHGPRARATHPTSPRACTRCDCTVAGGAVRSDSCSRSDRAHEIHRSATRSLFV